ncbi:MAG: hypothetical protein QM668_00820 [Agriterribacter sp.]
MRGKTLLVLFVFVFFKNYSYSQSIDLSNAVIWVGDTKTISLAKPLQVLKEEVQKRTAIDLTVVEKLPGENQPAIYIALSERASKLPKEIRAAADNFPEPGNEGFKLIVHKPTTSVIIVAKDARSVLYGIGRFLRKAEMRNNQLSLPETVSVSTTPKYPIRGHQLGFRPKTNSYDAFSVKQFDQYIRELALFGANSIEIMPPRTDDDDTSVHMKLRPEKMIIEQAKICKAYNLDVWMWYPNMGPDYSNRDSLKKEIQERMEVFGSLPKLDHVFVPGGDPGDLEPDQLFSWLGKIALSLRQMHPKAKVWVSPQAFRPTKKWMDDFIKHANSGYPWFGGVVFGPWVKIPVAELRKQLKDSIPIRMYPDITHSYTAQYPVPDWDVAYTMTLGRECINPRPEDEKHIHNVFAKYGAGSISYSEGTNDDVNKFVWSDQDWDLETPVIETIRDYCRLFFGSDLAESAAQGIMNLEKNFRGPLLINKAVAQTLMQWQDIEKKAPDELTLFNFRFQMCLLRAYYDALIQRRLIYETALESKAREVLQNATPETIAAIIQEAKEILAKSKQQPVGLKLKERCNTLADSLFSTIGAQLTVEKHGGVSGRGNFMDNIDMPLNDAPWLNDQLNTFEKITDANEMMAKVNEMLHRTDPGPGGFYDHFGSEESRSKVISNKTWAEDPGSLESPRKSYGIGIIGEEWVDEIKAQGFSGQTTPAAWMTQINTLYDQPLQIKYENLDTTASYKMRITYTGRFRSKVKLVANDNIVIHDFLQTGQKPVYEFDIPHEATAGGKVVFTWNCGEGERGSQVTEIWLMKK